MSNQPSGSKYPPYYPPPVPQQPSYSSQPGPSQHQAPQHAQHSPSPSVQIDPALSLYPQQYYPYQQSPQSMGPPPINVSGSYSSPSSHSETIPTPPADQPTASTSSNANGKRPATNGSNPARKKSRKEDDGDEHETGHEKGDEPKAKSTRGSRACLVCRRLKMKCVGAENGPPCKRCQAGNHECVFEESNRGKRTTNPRKHEVLTRSLRKMERTLDTIFRSLGTPSDVISRSPSPNAPPMSHPLLASPSPPPESPSQQHHPHIHPQVQFSPHLHSDHPPTSPKLPSLPDDSLNPLGLLAETSLANRRAQAGPNVDQSSTAMLTKSSEPSKMGVASDVYFKPGPMTILPLRRLYIERQIQPEMLTFVSTEEVVELFKIYFDNMNVHCSLLDPDFHTPSLVCSRSPFLLTTICSIASRFYPQRAELHPRLSELSKKLAFSAPARGYKSVEIVQAYLLNTLWGCGPVERFEQDRTWLLLGMGIRMATDLNLHRRTEVANANTEEGHAREQEVHNRERTWIMCFCLDRSFSAQMGKPYSIKEDYVIRNVSRWCRAPCALPMDLLLAAYSEFQRVLTRSLDLLYSNTSSPSGLQADCDYLLITNTMETQLLGWQENWLHALRSMHDDVPEIIRRYGEINGRFCYHYGILVINSFGLQDALQRSAVDIGHFFTRCHSAAVKCATIIRDEFGPRGYLKYAPDSHFVRGSYAVLSLLKLLRPEFKAFLDHEQKSIDLVKGVADIFESVAEAPLHTPALYSHFLRALLSAKTDPDASVVTATSAAAANPAYMQPQRTPPESVRSNDMPPPPVPPAHMQGGTPAADAFSGFYTAGEMGPVADISTFPPTMVSDPPAMDMSMLSMDSILSADFWDSVLVPGSSNSMDSLNNGFVYGAGGTGLITPLMWMPSPTSSMATSPARPGEHRAGEDTTPYNGTGQKQADLPVNA
ncbi:hypothetical protein B0H21DRAFT_17239 [Amylocystis lapponica]|nr:hypothetical protein B0H21DRAFT_17239 [Amylocystis lapponica]